MPPLVIALIVCVGLFMLFPKGFKYMVGTSVGFMFGFMSWTIAAFWDITTMWNPTAFLCFIVAGIIAGIVLAAKG